jgi:transglutaminase-like putative cysteine protease
MKRRDDMIRLVTDWLLLVPGLLGSVYCLISAFDLPASEELWAIAIGSIILFTLILGHGKQDRISVLLLLVGLVIPAYLFRAELLESFRNLWGVLSTAYAKGYDFFLDYVPKEETTPETVGTALLALTALEAYLCCLAVRVWKRTTPMALSLMLCIAPCFVLTDTPPDTLPLLAAVFSVLTQAFSQSVRRRETFEQGKSVLASALLSLVILGVLITIYPQETYSPPLSWDMLAEKMERWSNRWNNQGNVNAGLAGNPSSVDLSDLPTLPRHPDPILYATSSVDAYLYLRGSSYTDFDGIKWTRGAEETWAETTLFPYLDTQGGATLDLETWDTEPLLYTTYQLTRMPAGTLVSDAYVNNNSLLKQYSMQFVVDPGPVTPISLYDQWVYEHCLSLPEETREGVLAWWEANGLPDAEMQALLANEKHDAAWKLDFARIAANRVSSCAVYSRSPAALPEDADFCTWFLNDAEEGYCVHYATSCAALLRALEIPARYVSGYVCDAKANQQARITNLQAHAWVEAWIGGRWVVVEPTPEDATEFTGIVPSAATPQPVESSYDPLDRPKPTREKPVPTAAPPAEVTQPGQNAGNNPGNGSKTVNLSLLWVFLAVSGGVALVLGRRSLLQKHWEKRLAQASPNKRALLLYRRMRRLEKAGGGTVPEEAVALAKKATFSQHTLDDRELQFLQQVCKDQQGRMAVMSLRRRLYCKYVLCLT